MEVGLEASRELYLYCVWLTISRDIEREREIVYLNLKYIF